mmetsp:Transcript_39287/g.90868  ORF Transcript_39287/g.90868 Transcript_39287/m.90868 type:complete len:217 (-) Transcript_39287:347-997(-)
MQAWVAICDELRPPIADPGGRSCQQQGHENRLQHRDAGHNHGEGHQPLPLVKLAEVCDEEGNEDATEQGVKGAGDPKECVLHLPVHQLLVSRVVPAGSFVHKAALPQVPQQGDRKTHEGHGDEPDQSKADEGHSGIRAIGGTPATRRGPRHAEEDCGDNQGTKHDICLELDLFGRTLLQAEANSVGMPGLQNGAEGSEEGELEEGDEGLGHFGPKL